MANKSELTKPKNTAVATASFEEYGNEGFSEVTAEDLAIPFLRILDTKSPQAMERSPDYIEGVKPGMFFNNVLKEGYDGIRGVDVIACHYNRRYNEWVPRDLGGGFKGSYLPTDPIVNTIKPHPDPNIYQELLPNGNILANTAQFFSLMLHEELGPQRVLIPMASSQLKKSRSWLSNAQAFTGKKSDGSIYTMPLMSQVWTLTSVQEKNARGDWFGFSIKRKRQLDLDNATDLSLFETAVSFALSVKAGDITAQEKSANVTEPMDDEVPF